MPFFYYHDYTVYIRFAVCVLFHWHRAYRSSVWPIKFNRFIVINRTFLLKGMYIPGDANYLGMRAVFLVGYYKFDLQYCCCMWLCNSPKHLKKFLSSEAIDVITASNADNEFCEKCFLTWIGHVICDGHYFVPCPFKISVDKGKIIVLQQLKFFY